MHDLTILHNFCGRGLGLTLPVVIRRLRVRQAAARSALDRLESIAEQEYVSPEIIEGLRARYLRRAERYGDEAEDDEEGAEQYRAIRREVLDAERRALIDLRGRGMVGDVVLRKIQHQLDLEQVRLDAEMP